MGKLGERLPNSAREARAIARGTLRSKDYGVHVPEDIDVRENPSDVAAHASGICRPLRHSRCYATRVGTGAPAAGRSGARAVDHHQERAARSATRAQARTGLMPKTPQTNTLFYGDNLRWPFNPSAI